MPPFFIAQYLKDADFLSGFDKDIFHQEILDSGILTGIYLGIAENKIVDPITGNNLNDINGVQVWTSVSLTAQQQIDLDSLAQNHPSLPFPPDPPPGSVDGDLHAITHHPNGTDQIPFMGVAGATTDGLFGWVRPPPAGSTTNLVWTSGMTWSIQSGGGAPSIHGAEHLPAGNDPVPAMVGATGMTIGIGGLVPTPAAGDQDKVLFGDATFDFVSAKNFRMLFPLIFTEVPLGGVSKASIDNLPGYVLPDSTDDKGVVLTVLLADNANLNSLIGIRFDVAQFSVASVSTKDDIVFELQARYIQDGELPGKTADETLTTTLTWVENPSLEANDGQTLTGSFDLDESKMVGSERIMLTVFRLGNDAADTFDGECLMVERCGLKLGF